MHAEAVSRNAAWYAHNNYPRMHAGRQILIQGARTLQMFKRVFQLTQQQPIDECLALLGDCMVADLDSRGVAPVVSICRTTVTDQSVRARAWRGTRSERWAARKKLFQVVTWHGGCRHGHSTAQKTSKAVRHSTG